MTFGVKCLFRAVPTVEFSQEVPHDGNYRFRSGHGKALSVVVVAVQARLSYEGKDDLSENLAQQRPALLGNPVVPSILAGLTHLNIESGVAQEHAPAGEVAQRSGFGEDSSQIPIADNAGGRCGYARIILAQAPQERDKALFEDGLTVIVE